MPDRWEDVRVTIIRPGPTDPNGPCANAIPQDDSKAVTMQRGSIQYFTLFLYRPHKQVNT